MKSMNVKVISFLIIGVVLSSIIIYKVNSNYKNEIGGYDIYTLVMIEKRFDNFIEAYNNERLDVNCLKAFQDEFRILNEYIRRSPVLKFMNSPLQKISYYNLNDINEKEVEWMRDLQSEIRKITINLHEESKGDIGKLTYNYFKKKSNIENLNNLLTRLE